MDIDVQAGKYVVAVSGGVDSVVLLDLLARRQDMQLTVAHFDHGIRDDSGEDLELVRSLAGRYGLPFVYHQGKLGKDSSEAAARHARYDFLHEVRRASGAQAVLTAHHQDDVLETVILNLLRGTGRRGLNSLRSTGGIRRPLLGIPKQELLRYAEENGLVWHEDSTNSDTKYLRNHVRQRMLPRFSAADKRALLVMAEQAGKTNEELKLELVNYLHLQPSTMALDRDGFILLPHAVAREVMAEWLLLRGQVELSRNLLERLVAAAKTGRTGSKVDVDAWQWLEVGRSALVLRRK